MSKMTQNVDNYLNEVLNLCRKVIIQDESCLFRAVSEKIFFTQSYHKHVKANCLEYMERHAEEYQPFMPEAMENRIQKLLTNKESAGHLEIIILSRIYRIDFIVFHPTSLEQFDVTQNNFCNKIYLYYAGDNHYDLVYTKSHQQSSSICQSVLYELLYHQVFGMETEAEEAVVFLHIKKFRECCISDALSTLGKEKLPVIEKLSGRTYPPLPYRVAKALHPCIYRNVEYDIILEEIRETRISKQIYFSNFSIGDKCQVFLEEDDTTPYHGHIQDLDCEGGNCVVYIEELIVKKTLPARCIAPLPVKTGNQGRGEWPIAEIDLLRFQKRSRRKKTPTSFLFLTDNPNSLKSKSIPLPPRINSLGKTPVSSAQSKSCSLSVQALTQTIPSAHCQSYSQDFSENRSVLDPDLNCYITQQPHCSHNNSHQSFQDANNHQYRECGDSHNQSVIFSSQTLSYYTTDQALQQQQTVSDNPENTNIPSSNCHASLTTPEFVYYPSPAVADESNPAFYIGIDPTAYTPYPPTMSNQAASAQGSMFVMPMMAVPYNPTMGQVNIAWNPSQDVYPKDLSFSGVEYYHQPPHSQPVAAGNYRSPEALFIPQVGSEGIPYHTVVTAATDVNKNYCSGPVQSFPNPSQNQHMTPAAAVSYGLVDAGSCNQAVGGDNSSCSVFTTKADSGKGNSAVEDRKKSSADSCPTNNMPVRGSKDTVDSNMKEEKEENRETRKQGQTDKISEDDGNTNEHMDIGSDKDSGCPSDCTDLSPSSAPDKEFVGSTSTTEDSSCVDVSKPRGKRRYYMYGNHKLIKPIKEIPMRFQMLLSETRAAKARCEGQPIFMQQPPVEQPYDIVYYQTPDESSQLTQQPPLHLQQQPPPLNANANCFVPAQAPEAGMTYISEDLSKNSYSSNGSSFHPAPLFVPPPLCNTSQSGPAVIMYSNASSSSSYIPQCTRSQPVQSVQTISMPPPPFPPPTSFPPPPVDPSNPANIYPTLATRPQAVSSNLPSSTPLIELENKKSSKPLTLNLPSPYTSAPGSRKLTHPTPTSIPTTPSTNVMFPYVTHSYSKPSALPINAQSSIALDNSNPQTFALPPNMQMTSSISSSTCVPPTGVRAGNSQYMYVYPSTPTAGLPSNPPQGAVMYMVNPAPPYPNTSYPSPSFQNQGLLIPSVAAQ